MARGAMPAWVPAIVGVVLVVAVGAPLVERRLDGTTTATPSPATTATDARRAMPPETLPAIRFTEVKLGPSPGSRVAFDRAVAGHVLSCDSESHDGGRTWTAAVASAGRAMLCDDPPAAPVPGVVSAWTQASDGAAYAAVTEPGRRPHLMWAPGRDGPWRTVATPGDVRVLVADGARIYVAAEMLGRGAHESWDWTRWPPNVTVRGVTAIGPTVVGWGTVAGDSRGGYVVSRDGGVRLQLVIHGPQPLWAALDPHRPSDLLVAGEDGSLTRLVMPPG